MKSAVQIVEQAIEAEGVEWLLVLVADDDGRLLGSCQVNGWKSECPVLSSLWVRAQHRGQGIGTAIIRHVVDYGARAGKRAIGLTVSKTNERAEGLYRRLGFIQFSDDDKLRWLSYPLPPATLT